MKVKKIRIGSIIKGIFLVLIVLISVYPIIWTLVNSFRTNTQILSSFRLIPEQFDFSNYISILKEKTIITSFGNSVLVTGGTMVLTAAFSMMAAFVLSSYRFKGASVVYLLFTMGIFIPGATTMGMIYKLLQSFHLLGTRTGIVLLYTSGRMAISIFLLVSFMKAIPESVKEAALLDGCTPGQLFTRIIVPLTRNGLMIVLILTFINVWNDYVWSMILLPSASKRTLTVALAFFKGEFFTDYGLLSACVIVGLLPIVVAYVFMQDKIINGMAASAVKG